MVDVMQPDVMDTVADPATGTGGFLLAAYDYMAPQATSKKEQKHLRDNTCRIVSKEEASQMSRQ
jgi:type I restriction enzyme M protein